MWRVLWVPYQERCYDTLACLCAPFSPSLRICRICESQIEAGQNGSQRLANVCECACSLL